MIKFLNVKLKITKKGISLFANKNIKRDRIILPLRGKIKTDLLSSHEAVQIGDNKFIDTTYKHVPEDFIDHSCNPNAKIDFKTMNFVAIRDIKKGEEIIYNYLTTEYDLVKWKLDFKCKCGSKNCFKYIRGFKYLSLKEKLKLKDLLSPFLRKKLEEELKNKIIS